MTRILSAVAALAMLSAPAFADKDSALIAALWEKMATIPDLKNVDQIVVEGNGENNFLRGTLQKRDWLNSPAQIFEKRFAASFEERCRIPIPQCYVVKGIWSNGTPIDGSSY